MNIEQLIGTPSHCPTLIYKQNVTFSYKEVQILFDFLSKIINMNGHGFTVYHHILFIDNYKMIYQAMGYIEKEIKKHFNDEASNKINEYNQKQEALVEKYIDRDEQGNPVYRNNQPIITDNLVEFNNEIEKLNEEYKPYLVQAGNKQQEYQKFITENSISLEKFLVFDDINYYNELFTPTITSIYLDKT